MLDGSLFRPSFTPRAESVLANLFFVRWQEAAEPGGNPGSSQTQEDHVKLQRESNLSSDLNPAP